MEQKVEDGTKDGTKGSKQAGRQLFQEESPTASGKKATEFFKC